MQILGWGLIGLGICTVIGIIYQGTHHRFFEGRWILWVLIAFALFDLGIWVLWGIEPSFKEPYP